MTQTLTIHQMRAENCFAYLVADVDTRDAALVDPRVDRVAEYLADLEERGLRLRFFIDTHTHADHLSGAAELRTRTGADVLISAQAKSEVATRRLRDGDRVALGRGEIEVLASPGHTDDGVSLLVGDALLTGDALLIGGAGRTDFQTAVPKPCTTRCTIGSRRCQARSPCTQPTTTRDARIPASCRLAALFGLLAHSRAGRS
jgi:glyoxylase-like metal-dependent hydrolase (beta-lactamase superfamily II)